MIVDEIKQNCNFFGTVPHLFFQNKRIYKNSQGLFFTLLFAVCVSIAFWVYGKELIYREHPQTTYSETSNKHPERFNITKDSFNFVFGF